MPLEALGDHPTPLWGVFPAPPPFAHSAYPGVTRIEGISEAVDAALLQDHHSNQLTAG